MRVFRAEQGVSHGETSSFTVKNTQFHTAKQTVSHRETHCFSLRNTQALTAKSCAAGNILSVFSRAENHQHKQNHPHNRIFFIPISIPIVLFVSVERGDCVHFCLRKREIENGNVFADVRGI